MKHCIIASILVILSFCGCSMYPEPPAITVNYAEDIVVDGILEEKSWGMAPAYSLETARSKFSELHPELRGTYGIKPASPCEFRMLFDRNCLYVGAEMVDDDIFSLGKKDQMLHCNAGDVFEIFLKPEHANYYWEIHISPAGYCAVMFYPSRGYHFLPEIVLPEVRPLKKIKYRSTVTGTLNKFYDVDSKWILEAAIPLDELAAKGIPLDPQNQWRILIGRYNYSCHRKICELSSFPQLYKLNFHNHEEYGFLKLVGTSK